MGVALAEGDRGSHRELVSVLVRGWGRRGAVLHPLIPRLDSALGPRLLVLRCPAAGEPMDFTV
jgi:hypothetical protein